MSYIGFKPVQGNVIVDEFTSSGGSTYTLSSQPTNNNVVEVVVGGLTQSSSAYSFSGTTLTLAGVASGTKIIVRQHGEKLLIPTPGDDTVTGAKIVDNALDSEHYADGSIDTAHIADNAITAAKIADGTVVAAEIADGAITTAKMASGVIGQGLGSSSQWLRTNSDSISQNITIPSGTNAMSAGPMTLGNYTITINGVYTVI